jgi:hypothetical protein
MRRWLSAVVVAVVATTGSVTAVTPATADPLAATVIDLPNGLRDEPRGVGILGVTSLGISYSIEQNSNQFRGSRLGMFIANDGTETALDSYRKQYIGDREVSDSINSSSFAAPSRLLPDGDMVNTIVPTGWRIVDQISEGLILRVSGQSATFALLPWGEIEPLSFTGVPSGWWVGGTIATGPHGALVSIGNGTGATAESANYYLDATQLTARQIALPVHFRVRVTDTTIAWTEKTGSVVTRIGTLPLAEPEGAQLAQPTYRAAPAGIPNMDILPIGDQIVAFQVTSVYTDWGVDTVAPVYSIAPDGSAVTLLAWGHDVFPGVGDGIIAVGGADPHDQAIQSVNVIDASATIIKSISRVPARVSGIAVDGYSVTVKDDTNRNGAVRQFIVDPATGELSDPVLLAPTDTVDGTGCLDGDDRCAVLSAGEGSTIWNSGHSGAIMSNVDGVTTAAVGSPTTGFTSVSGEWVAMADSTILNTRTGQIVDSPDKQQAAVVDRGVLYTAGGSVESVPTSTIIAHNLSTGAATTIDLAPECASTGNPLGIAGSWIVAGCPPASGGARYVVIDRTGTTPHWTFASVGQKLLVGNGFLAYRESGRLNWAPLTASTLETQDLGAVDVGTISVAVSRTAPTLAWIDPSRHAHVAVLPVPTRADPDGFTGITSKPGAPVARAVPADFSSTVEWDARPASEQVTGYVASIEFPARSQRVLLPPTATSYTFRFATPDLGRTYPMTVTALNVLGKSPATSVDVVARYAAPLSPTSVTALASQQAGTIAVNWEQPSSTSYSAVTGYRVELRTGLGGLLDSISLTAAARSATFTSSYTQGMIVIVFANSEFASNIGQAPVLLPDTTAPVVHINITSGDVALDRTLAAEVSFTDADSATTAEVRLRRAPWHGTFGSWVYPAEWTGLGNSAVIQRSTLATGSTYCVSARAADTHGNLADWTADQCFAVPLDDRSMSRTGKWTSLKASYFYSRTAYRSASSTSTISANVKGSAVWLIATTCSTCGYAKVTVGNVTYKVSLYSPTTVRSAAVLLPFHAPTTRRVYVRPWSSSRSITVDGIAARDGLSAVPN